MHDMARLEERFRSAAVGREPWMAPLTELTEMLGAKMGQLAMVDGHGNLLLNVFTQHALDTSDDYMAWRGYDPAVNPRSRAIVSGQAMRCIVDEEFIDPQEAARSPIYQELFRPHDVPHAGLVPLSSSPADGMGGLTILWSTSAGAADTFKRRIVEALAPSLAAALSLSTHLEGSKAGTLLDTVEMLSGPAILLGPDRGIVGVSAQAEALLRRGSHLAMRAGRLGAMIAQCEAALDAAFRRTIAPGTMPGVPIKLVVVSVRDRSPMLLELHRLPRRDQQGSANARVLLTVRTPRPELPTSTADALRKAFDMTAAEAAVAELLGLGHDLATIATRRGVGIETIRSQLKSIFQKTGTRRQAELVIALAPYR
ncbi:helix-turn-helix transcriptional regulator [Sphingomonas sp. Tas61C01]|uniref:helix-turn-helix transcriptional regulator n=1 Tax=Sphingomonas sp. Tas61C01 TaxID=3458297 RepID=UPI00403ED3A8